MKQENTIKRIGPAAAAIFLTTALIFSGCDGTPAEGKEAPSSAQAGGAQTAEQGASILFPAYQTGKTEQNAKIYEIEPFRLSIRFPDGWTVKEREPDDGFELFPLVTPLSVLDEEGACVGAVGYQTYEPYEGAEVDPRAIYSQIALGNDYHFDVRDSYRVVAEPDWGVTALADVYYSAVVHDGVEKNNRGIVSHNRELLVYVAAEFDREQVTEEQLSTMAESIQLLPGAP